MFTASRGISGIGRAELSAVIGERRFVSPEIAARALGVDGKLAARKLAHWAEQGWLRRVRRGLYIAVWHEDVRLLIADPARTVVEILDTPRIGGGIRHAAEILRAYLDEHDGEPLVQYALRLGNRAVLKRLGYLLESQDWGEPELIAARRAALSSGISLLDPDGPHTGPRVPAWRLRANVAVEPQEPS